MGRIENTLYEAVWGRAKHYAGLWDVKTALSAGIAALDLLTPQEREKAIAIAKNKVRSEKMEGAASGSYQLLSSEDQEALDQFREAVSLSGADEALEVVRNAIATHAKAHRKKNPSRSAKTA